VHALLRMLVCVIAVFAGGQIQQPIRAASFAPNADHRLMLVSISIKITHYAYHPDAKSLCIYCINFLARQRVDVILERRIKRSFLMGEKYITATGLAPIFINDWCSICDPHREPTFSIRGRTSACVFNDDGDNRVLVSYQGSAAGFFNSEPRSVSGKESLCSDLISITGSIGKPPGIYRSLAHFPSLPAREQRNAKGGESQRASSVSEPPRPLNKIALVSGVVLMLLGFPLMGKAFEILFFNEERQQGLPIVILYVLCSLVCGVLGSFLIVEMT
jgi:hypothetical protein